MLKERINAKGLKPRWVAEQIGVNYSSLRVYLNNESLMPEKVKTSLKKLLA